MANEKNNIKDKKPKFNPYWIYGIVIAVFLAIQVFSSVGSQEGSTTNPTQFLQFVADGDVEKVEIVNKRIAKVYLTREAEQKEIHKKSIPNTLIPTATKLPNYKFEFGDL